MARDRELILHIGAHKTASTMLQRALSDDQYLLREHDVHLVPRSRIEKSELQRILASVAKTGKRPSDAATDTARESFKNLAETDAKKVLLTNEGLLERLRQARFYENIKAALSWLQDVTDTPTKVILFTRSQPDYLESLYMQTIHLGGSSRFSGFLDSYPDVDLSWTRVLDDIASIVGAGNTQAIPYESIKRIGSNAYYYEFLRIIGVTGSMLDLDGGISTARVANRSYSAEALELARVINPLIPRNKVRVLRKFLQENYSTATHERPVLFESGERRRILKKYSDANRRLFEEYMEDWRADEFNYQPA